MAAGTGMPAHLVAYWVDGAGGSRIAWGTDGDYSRCLVEIQAKVSEHGAPLGDNVIHGLCATLHKVATGARPGHAPGEHAGH
jgi:hypothetical protein